MITSQPISISAIATRTRARANEREYNYQIQLSNEIQHPTAINMFGSQNK